MSILTQPGVSAFLTRHKNHIGEPRPTAVFDCDGTVIAGDIGEAMFYHQIEHFFFRRSPASVWADHPERAEIEALYRKLLTQEERTRRLSAEFAAFADYLLSWYFGQIGQDRVAKACADIVRLFTGFSPEEVRAFAAGTFAAELSSPVGTRRLGRYTLPLGVRFIRESVDLIAELRRLGFEVWALSGSNRWSVEPVFGELGIGPERVVGIELETSGGLLTDRPVEPVPIRGAKIEALRRHTAAIPVLTASDSKNDIPLLLYSSDLKVRVNSRNRDTADFFRTANVEPDERWVLLESPAILA